MFIYIFIAIAFSWETDNYSCRYQPLTDVSAPLNQEVNRRINKVLTVGIKRRIEKPTPSDNRQFIEKQSVYGGNYSTQLKIVSTVFHQKIVTSEPERLIGCDRTELYSALRGILASAFMGRTV